jgi:hypothetical protein
LYEQGELRIWLDNEGHISWASVETRLRPFARFFRRLFVQKKIHG